jgi:hypothetical protein
MNAAEILVAVQEAGASLRVQDDSLVASNASRLAPELKVAIRQNKPQLIAALKPTAPLAETNDGGRVEVIELPQAQRYRKVFAHLQLALPALVPVERWQQCVEDGKRFLALAGRVQPVRPRHAARAAASVLSAAIEIRRDRTDLVARGPRDRGADGGHGDYQETATKSSSDTGEPIGYRLAHDLSPLQQAGTWVAGIGRYKERT